MANGSDRSWDTPPNVEGILACIADWDPARGLHQGQQSSKRLHQQAEDKTASDQCQSIISSIAMREPSRQDISELADAETMKASYILGTLGAFVLLATPAQAERKRPLPAGYHTGRCLLVVDGKQRIAGKCFYQISKGGGFHIDGPRQVYDGIDYPKAEAMADKVSKDYWADVFPDDGGWSGYGNSDIAAVHGDRPWALHRQGACYVGDGAKICLWRR